MLLRLATLLLVLSFAITIALVARDPSWWIVPALLAGWYVADFASGVVHMTMDYRACRAGVGLDRLYFYAGSRESDEYQALFRAAMARINPVERLCYDFKNHHPRPDALGRRGFLRLCGSTIVAGTLPAAMLLDLAAILVPLPGWAVAGGAAMLVGGTFAQYFHGSLHRTRNPAIVEWLRRAGLLMTPAAHQKHHDSLKRDFATNCGWSNPVVNRLFAFAYRRRLITDEGLEPRG